MKGESVSAWLFQTFATFRRKVVLIVFAALVSAAASAAFPVVWQMLLDKASDGYVDKGLSALFLALFLVEASQFVYWVRSRFVNQYECVVRHQLYEHLLRLSVPFYKSKDRDSTIVMSQAEDGADAGGNLMRIFLTPNVIADVPVAIFSMWYISLYSTKALGAILFFFLAFALISYSIGRRVGNLREEYERTKNSMFARQREVLAHIEIVKLYQAESHESKWGEQESRKLLALNYQMNWMFMLQYVMNGLAGVLPFGIALALFLPQVADKSMTIGALIALQLYSIRAIKPVGFVGVLYQEITINVARLKPALRLLTEKPTVLQAKNPAQMNPLRHQIEVQDVVFFYPGASKPTIHGLSLLIRAGEKLALVGKSGSGKSTLARLLVRFYDPTHGVITMDGTDLRSISFESLYDQIGYAPQEVPIFSDTIANNVCYGRPEMDFQNIEAVCRNASADFVFSQENGLETKVGEQGVRLSGGERQRLALARLLLRKPSLVILDEATASLDTGTEHQVQAAFDSLINRNGGVTLVVIAHRITTVRNADRIVVLDQGRVSDSGTHEELLGRCELYRELCKGMAE